MGQFTIRRAVVDDIPPAYAMFRRSLFDYLYRMGVVGIALAKDPPITDAWRRQSPWVEHLWTTAKENWVALDNAGQLIGWALSIERNEHLELSVFFVDPGFQGKGLGRELVSRAVPQSGCRHLTINATQDPRALSVYLRSGVRFASTSVDVLVRPTSVEKTDDLTFERLAPCEDAVEEIVAVERDILGFARRTDIRFLLQRRPAWMALRGGRPVGFAFGVQPNPPDTDDVSPGCGPMAALNPSDIPSLVDLVIRSAVGIEEFTVTVPLANHRAVQHLLHRGGQIDPFYMMTLTTSDDLSLDRYVHTSPPFIL
ncbi:GNAT family N-acetyltransferase [Tabrizicola sp.]|uniref:GNAT family N-acetyltransferase n=1 Tax=Tabrizicola sp. TaxID=2005166 RepID=UPI0025D9966C|nr:GNAT family N-acetyltransferase [Tabrizicola sp.]